MLYRKPTISHCIPYWEYIPIVLQILLLPEILPRFDKAQLLRTAQMT